MTEKLFPPSHLRRIEQYDKREAILDGRFTSAVDVDRLAQEVMREKFLNLPDDTFTRVARLAVSIGAFVSRTFADLLFLESPKLSSRLDREKEDEWLRGFVEQNDLDCMLWESALSNSALGDEYFKVRMDEGQEYPIVESQDPRSVVVEFSPRNQREVLAYRVLTQVDEATWLEERHEVGRIRYRVVITDSAGSILDTKSAGDMDLPDEVITGVDDFLVVHVPNLRKSREFFGVSDYQPNLSLFDEINNRLSRLVVAMDMLADPKFQGPPTQLNPQGQFQFSGGKYYGLNPEEKRIEAIVWDPKLQDQLDVIEKLVVKAIALSELWPGLAFPDKFGQADSGRALRLRMMRTMWARNRKRKFYGQAIGRATSIAEELAGAFSGGRLGFDPERPAIEWHDVLPFDRAEAVDEEAIRLRGGLTSVESALRRLMPRASEDEIAEELDRIAEDEANMEPQFMRDSGGRRDRTGGRMIRTPSPRLPGRV